MKKHEARLAARRVAPANLLKEANVLELLDLNSYMGKSIQDCAILVRCIAAGVPLYHDGAAVYVEGRMIAEVIRIEERSFAK